MCRFDRYQEAVRPIVRSKTYATNRTLAAWAGAWLETLVLVPRHRDRHGPAIRLGSLAWLLVTPGQGLNIEGGLWWVVSPSGKWITKDKSSATTTKGSSGRYGTGY